MRRALSLVAASFLALALAGTVEAKHRHSRSCGHSHGYSSHYSESSYGHYHYAPQPVVVYRPYYRPVYRTYYRPYHYHRPHSHVSLHFSFGH